MTVERKLRRKVFQAELTGGHKPWGKHTPCIPGRAERPPWLQDSDLAGHEVKSVREPDDRGSCKPTETLSFVVSDKQLSRERERHTLTYV